jgi:hypothetical protein
VIVLWVVDAEAARRLLRAGLLRCPDCRGTLRAWASARAAALAGYATASTFTRVAVSFSEVECTVGHAGDG